MKTNRTLPLFVALLLTTFFRCPSTADALESDDFAFGPLNGSRWEFVDPVGDSSAVVVDQALQIQVPAGSSHDLWGNNSDAPRVVQAVADEDFEMEVKFESEVLQMYQMQGIVIEQDGGNYLRFDVHSTGSSVRAFAASVTDGSSSVKISQGITAWTEYYLRVGRVGDQWTFQYSYDGVEWGVLGSFTHFIAVSSVGVFAGNAGQSPAFTAEVDYVFNTASPIEPEDSLTGEVVVNVSGSGSVTKTPDLVQYDLGSTLQLTALPDVGWTFAGWSGAAAGTSPNVDVLVTGNLVINAQFAPGNDTPPTITAVADQVVDEDTGIGPLSFVVGDQHTAAEDLVVTSISSNVALIPASGIVLGGSGASRDISLVIAADQSGSAEVTIVVDDGELTSSESFVVTVNPVNDLPVISSLADQVVDQGATVGPLSFSIDDVENDPASLLVTATSLDPVLVPQSGILLGGSGADRTVTVTPAPGRAGNAVIEIAVNDGTETAKEEFVLTVMPPPGPLVSDDFALGTLSDAIWQFVDPVGDCTVSIVGKMLQIQVPAGASHDLWGGSNDASRVVQAVADEDFEMEVKFESEVLQMYQMQGIVIEQDGGNYLRFDVHSTGSSVRAFAASVTDGSSSVKIIQGITAWTEYYLLVGRVGDQWTFQYSYDGVEWEVAGSFTHSLAVSSVGVFAGNAGPSPAFTAEVDYVFNTASPIEPEDSLTGDIVVTVNGNGTVAKNPDLAEYDRGTTVELNAVPDAGWLFAGWSGAAGGANNPIGVVSIGDLQVGAQFLPENDTPPSITAIADQIADEDSVIGPLSFSVSDQHTTAAALVVTASSSNAALISDSNIVLGGSGATRDVSLTPAADQIGTTEITLVVSDGLLTASEVFVVTVSPVNDLPSISQIADQVVDEGESSGLISFTIDDLETAAGSLQVSATSLDPVLLPESGIVLGGSGSNRTVTVTPAPGLTGSGLVELSVSDGDSFSTETFAVTVKPPPGPPVSDDFASAPLDVAIWEIVDPVGDSSVEVIDQALHIHVPGGVAHDAWNSNESVRVMQEVTNGDFELEAKFESGVEEGNQFQGILVEQDDANFMRFDVLSNGSSVRAFAAITVNGTATSQISKTITPSAQYFLRVGRAGDLWSFEYSYDGFFWDLAGTFTHAVTMNRLGVFAGNASGASSPEFTAVVDYVFNTAEPIQYEDVTEATLTVTIRGSGTVGVDPDQTAYQLGQTVELTATPDAGWEFAGWQGAGGGVTLVEDAVDESAGNLPAYRIETPSGTYYLEKSGAGLSSMVDVEGNDWIAFHPAAGSGAGGEYRGFPNAVFVGGGGYFHPLNDGTNPCETVVVLNEPNLVSIVATSLDGKWAGRYDFTPTHCTFTMIKMPQSGQFWFLYEGVPGGDFDNDDWWMTSEASEKFPMTVDHNGDILGSEWIAFGDPAAQRSLVVYHHEDDNSPDSFFQLDNQMTVFGFGREGGSKFLNSVPQSVSIGFVESDQYGPVGQAAAGMAGIPNGLVIMDASENPVQMTLTGAHEVVTLFVPIVNTEPTITAIADQIIDEDTTTGQIGFTIGDAESDAEDLNVTVVSSDPALVPYENLLLDGSGAPRTLEVIPGVNQSGIAEITLFVEDGAAVASVSFAVTILESNDAPTISPIQDQAVVEGGVVGPLAFEVSDIETDPGALEVIATSSNPALLPESGIALGGSGTDRTITVTPAVGVTGLGEVEVTVSDGSFVAVENFLVTVIPSVGPFESDDFAAGSIDLDRWEFVNPLGDGTFQATGSSLEISVPGGSSHDVWTSGNLAPRLVQEIDDFDFEVEAKFYSTPSWSHQLQGIIVEEDAATYMRFDVVSSASGTNLYAAGFVSGSVSIFANEPIDWIPGTRLRVTREGNLWSYAWSLNGFSWNLIASFFFDLQVDKVGVFAGNAGSNPPPFTAEVDYVFNTAAPIVPEDGGVLEIVAVSNGIGEILTDQPAYNFGDPAEFTAVPAENWEFSSWSGGVSGVANPLNVTSLQEDLVVVANFAPLNGGALIDVWYGDQQTFGANGIPQTQINILGAITLPSELESLALSVNGTFQNYLSVGPGDNIRLAGPGDFNAEIDFSELQVGNNIVTLTATLLSGEIFTRGVIVNYQPNSSPPLTANIDWSTVTDLGNVVQVVDGKWDIVPDGVRSVEPHYDRLLAIGDVSWQDFEVEVSITVNEIMPTPAGYWPAVGVLLRWDGHDDWGGDQPRIGWYPLGAIGWMRWLSNGGTIVPDLQIWENDGSPSSRVPRTWEFGATYIMKMRVETLERQSASTYSLKVWKQGEPEPTGWDIVHEATEGLDFGSVGLLSHYTDATFGNVIITPISLP